MRYRTYLAKSQDEALKKIKDDLGLNAVIISVKKVNKRSFPYWIIPKKYIEVVAAIDDSTQSKTNPIYKREDVARLVYEDRKSVV